ncbi:MAG: 5-formyltetrahydrofolate cyclo-ligase [Thiotrichaceae bacterium]|nr:5-formyltetrahydrofolate cyclo-ligase [Thiotrichaceae bacterium]
MLNSSKDDIRKVLLLKRKQLTKQEQQQKSELITNRIKQSDTYKQAKKIAFYHAVRGEADPSSLMDNEKQFYLPILSSNKDQGLVFAPIDQNTQYKNNQFSIPEPMVAPEDFINAESLDLVIMPLLGFDLKGNRLGMGGGYYDRSFAFKKTRVKKPVLVGFAYDFQQVDALTAESWDVGLDAIAIESQFIDLFN